MPKISPARLRRAASQARRRLGGETAAVRDLQRHLAHVEKRLHLSEYRLRQLVEAGLTTDEPQDPEAYARWLTWRPPGHFYSPVPNLHDIEAQADTLWPEKWPAELPGIDLRPDEQLDTFRAIAKLARGHEVYERKTEPWRYYTDNVAYDVGDALTLHGMLRHIRPPRLIEIGSGHSSAMTLDTVEHYLAGSTDLTFIEPHPELLESLMQPGDRARVTIIPSAVQEVPLETFAELEAGDVLFIDSTHVLKTGSDVAWLYANVLPALNQGVYVHIHDMFYPFEYRREWVLEGRAWNEVYVVRAFLTNNSDYQIELFNDWLGKLHEDVIDAELPPMLANPGGALWLKRAARSR